MIIRELLSRILHPEMHPNEFLEYMARAAKDLNPDELEARVYEVDFIENLLYLRTSTQIDVSRLPTADRHFTIRPHTITGDAIIENKVVTGSQDGGYSRSRFREGEEYRTAFPIEFYDVDLPEGRTKYVLVVDKKGNGPLAGDVMDALKDFSIMAGLAVSIKELRDRLSKYYEHNRNMVLSGRHAAAIAHDIRSLNVGVGGYLTLALKLLAKTDQNENKAKIKKYLHLAQDNAGQVEVLLKNFSEFNRTAIELHRDTDLAEVVAEKLNSLKSRMDFNRIVRFEVVLPQGGTAFKVDRDWFGTVIENLVKNSLEACRGKTRIKVGLVRDDDKLILSFEDDCGGIPQDILPDVFTPFLSGKKTSQGLGLANAKKVVADHGGTIKVVNTDRGVRFTIEFNHQQGDSPAGFLPGQSQ